MPRIKYLNAAGKEVVGTTTVLGLLNKPALLKWAWEQGKKGLDFNKIRDTAANIGTIAHYLCECDLRGKTPNLGQYSPDDVAKAENAYLAFLEFRRTQKLTPLYTELSLVSEEYQYGGTIDVVAMLNGKKALVDLKTSKGIFFEMRLQLAAYRNLLIEHGHEIESMHILRIDKESGEFAHYQYNDLSEEFEMFKDLLKVYRRWVIISKR
jgi:hypothetical protein